MTKDIQMAAGGINFIFAGATSYDNFYDRAVRATMIKSEKFEDALLRQFPDSMFHPPTTFQVKIFVLF